MSLSTGYPLRMRRQFSDHSLQTLNKCGNLKASCLCLQGVPVKMPRSPPRLKNLHRRANRLKGGVLKEDPRRVGPLADDRLRLPCQWYALCNG